MPTSPQGGESMRLVLPTIIVWDSDTADCMCDPSTSALNPSSAEYAAARKHLTRLIQEKSHATNFSDVGILPNPPPKSFDCTIGGLFFNYKNMRSLQNAAAAGEAPRRDSIAVEPQHQPQHLAQRFERLSLGQLFLGGPVITLTDVDGPARKARSNSETDALEAQARRFLHVPQAEVSDEPMRPPM